MKKKLLDQIAKNLLVCCKRSVDEVIQSLDKDQADYLLNKIEELRKGSSL